jgi:L-fuculose-phosphate aldolase
MARTQKANSDGTGRAGGSPTQQRSPTARSGSRMPAAERQLRSEIIDTARAMSRMGLSPGRSGNVSARFGDGMLITPSGMPYDTLEPADIVFVAADGTVADDARKPSSEWRFHLSALEARPDRAAVVHTHSENAVVLACRHAPIPAFHYMVAAAGGTDIPCIPYATFGTGKLARYVAKGLAQRDAVLMANHGQIALGATLSAALELAAEVETLAGQYVKVLTLGKPKLLSDKQMQIVLSKFQSYGQNAQKQDEN